MSGVGFSELVILTLIGLIILGPRRLASLANQLGRWVGQARRMTRMMRRQLEEELNFDEDFNIKPPKPHIPKADDTYSPAHHDKAQAAGTEDKPKQDADVEKGE